MNKKSKPARGATKGTTLKYSKVVAALRAISKPTRINSTEYAKKHSVSTNLILSLISMGFVKKEADGYVWNTSAKGTDMEIAEKARIMANHWTNKRKPTRQRPTGKRAYKGRKTKVKTATEPVAKRKYTKRAPVAAEKARKSRQVFIPDTDKVELAREFSKLGLHKDALSVLRS